jgi:choline dehydrogenase-like flavoprotein
MITSGPDHVGERIDCDVLIVGSGAGGGAAAWRLARAGLRVVCLEEGGHYTEADFSQDVGTAWRQLYAEDGQRLMSGSLFIPVAGGKALGGSTVVNSGICFRIPEWRFDEWHDEYGIDFRWEELLGKLLEAEEVIGVTRVNTAVWGGNNQFLEEARQTLGWSGGPMQRNAPNCVGCGACNSGCPSGAKLSVAKTYIPRAEKHGAGFVTHARAERAILEGTRITGVLAGALDPATEESVGTFEVRAKAVVLAGGAIQTPAFLLHNGLGNEHVGKHLHVHPGIGAICKTDQKIQGWRGMVQAFYVDEFLHSDRYILESYWATPEIYYQSFPFGMDGTSAMQGFGKMAALGGVIADETEGSIRSMGTPGRVKIRYDLTEADKNRLVRMQRKSVEVMLAGGGFEIQTAIYGVPPISTLADADRFLVPENIKPKQLMAVYSSHPHGSTRMSVDPAKGAVDCSGAVYGTEGLYVMDGSVFPDVLGVNPQVTIMALSSLLADRLASTLT